MPKEKAEKSLCMSGPRHAEYYGMQEVFDGLYAKSNFHILCISCGS